MQDGHGGGEGVGCVLTATRTAASSSVPNSDFMEDMDAKMAPKRMLSRLGLEGPASVLGMSDLIADPGCHLKIQGE